MNEKYKYRGFKLRFRKQKYLWTNRFEFCKVVFENRFVNADFKQNPEMLELKRETGGQIPFF